jgi:hypothetical protein
VGPETVENLLHSAPTAFKILVSVGESRKIKRSLVVGP